MSHPYPKPVVQAGFQGRIGVARADITPPIGIYARSWGAALHEVMDGVHRPLTATAITFQQAEESPLVLFALDLGWWRTPEDEYFVREGVLQALDLSPAQVLINLAHTHAGPALCREDSDKPGGEYIAPYLDTLRESLARLAVQALANAEPAVLEWTTGKCQLAQYRDLPEPETDRYLTGYNPDGTPDDTLLVGRVTTLAGQPLATLVNYACHPVTLAWQNRLLSPDWVGAMRETVEQHTNQTPCLFLQGASGELAPRESYSTTEVSDAQGREIGYAVLATLTGMLPPQTRLAYTGIVESGAPLAVWEREVQELPNTLRARQVNLSFCLQPMPTLAELDHLLHTTEDRALAERLHRKRRIRKAVGDGDATRMPLWAWQLGDSLWIAHPNEAYSALQTTLRERFPDHTVVVMNVTNGHFGYLPPDPLYDQDIYPVWQTPFDRGGLGRLIGASTEALKALISEENDT